MIPDLSIILTEIAAAGGAEHQRSAWATDRRGADGVVARAGEAVGEDDLVPRLLLAHPGLGVGEVPPVA
jgi:hypothetical protein